MLDLLLGPPRRRAEIGAALSLDSTVGWQTVLAGRRTRAGVSVDPETALTWAAVWCATRVISETSGMLPCPLYKKTADGGREVATEHRGHRMFKFGPNPDMPPMVFREGRIQHQVNWGNGFAEIERDFNENILYLWPIHPSRVVPMTDNQYQDGYEPGDYWVRNNRGGPTPIRKRNMVHIPGCLSDDGIWGKGVIAYHRELIAFGLATERHGAEYFGSGAQPIGILTTPGMKNEDARRELRKEWKEVHAPSNGGKSGEIAIFPKDTTYTPITINNEDSQFIETRKLNKNEVATIYRVPPHMIGDLDRSTNNNIEHQGIEFVQYSLMPWLVREAQEYNAKLLTEEEREAGYYFEQNVDALLRGDYYTRMQGNEKSILSGQSTINEVRRRENEPTIGPAGDQHFVPLNYTTAERMLEGPPEPKDTKEKPESAPKEDKAAAKAFLRDALSRAFTREANAVKQKGMQVGTDFDAWLQEFHAGHLEIARQSVREAAALAGVVAEALAMGMIGRSGEALLMAYNTATRDEMNAMLDGWATRRVGEEMNILFPGAG